MKRQRTIGLIAIMLVSAIPTQAFADNLSIPDNAVAKGWEPHTFCFGYEAPGRGTLVMSYSFWRPCLLGW